jgi:Tfp pilus assembly protein PilF
MTLDSHEYGLDYAPLGDMNPWRPLVRFGKGAGIPLLPLGALLGLALAGLLLRGVRGTGGYEVWAAIVACAAAPLLFYVSSRYRLPFAALLVIPAGCGLAAIVRRPDGMTVGRRLAALLTAAAICAVSLLVPFHGLKTTMAGEDLAKRAEAHRKLGDLETAQREIDEAMKLAPASALLRHNAGVLAESRGDPAAAESLYRDAFALDPDLDAAAGNLGALLILGGRADEAIPLLRRALEHRPASALCWTNLVAAHLARNEIAAARAAVREAGRAGAELDPGLVRQVEEGAAE